MFRNVLLLSASCCIVAAASSSPSTPSSSTTTTTFSTITAPTTVSEVPLSQPPPSSPSSSSSSSLEELNNNNNGNPVAQLGRYVWDSITSVKDGTTTMYTNFRRCNAIREKQKTALKSLQSTMSPEQWKVHPLSKARGPAASTGITYEEFTFLQRGREDRGKLGNILFIMVASPNFFPYYVMFFPKQLPSAFARKALEIQSKYADLSRERAHAVIRTLLDMEREAVIQPPLSNINPFGRGKVRRAMQRMAQLGDITASILTNDKYIPIGSPSSLENNSAEAVLNLIDDELFTTEEPTRDHVRLSTVPKPIVRGIGRAIDGDSVGGPTSSFTPHFMTRGKVVQHIEKIAMADEFMVRENIDIATLDSNLLSEACAERLIAGCGESRSEDDMRNSLSSWLESSVARPKARMKQDGTYFNANLARFALMCYHVVDSARDARSTSCLPRLLFQGVRSSSSTTTSPVETKEQSKSNTRKRKNT